MKLYSYVLKNDRGFAPNPFFGYCTLACCKPRIRKKAEVGDRIVGITSNAKHSNSIVYSMKVEEVLTFRKYWNDTRFKDKKPSFETGRYVDEVGDNVYEPLTNGDFKQHTSMHSNTDCENCGEKEKDLGGLNVLVARSFAYFGLSPKEIPPELRFIIVGRSHRCKFTNEKVEQFERWISQFKEGIHSRPDTWPTAEFSWRKFLV